MVDKNKKTFSFKELWDNHAQVILFIAALIITLTGIYLICFNPEALLFILIGILILIFITCITLLVFGFLCMLFGKL